MEELVGSETKGKGRVEVLDFSVIREGSSKINEEARRDKADEKESDQANKDSESDTSTTRSK